MLSIGTKIRPTLLLIVGLLGTALSIAGCSPRHNDETLAGVTVPIPAPLKKLPASEDRVNFGLEQKGEQASFRGEMSRSEIIRFYQESCLPATGNLMHDSAQRSAVTFLRAARKTLQSGSMRMIHRPRLLPCSFIQASSLRLGVIPNMSLTPQDSDN
jgi:hypothetical protein